MKSIVIIQARTGSTRLPGKVLKELKGKTVLEHVIERVSQSKEIDNIVIATTDLKEDDDLYNLVKSIGVECYRGSSHNVLSRYCEASKIYDGDVIVRITSDCPLIDPNILDEMLSDYKDLDDKTIMTNAGSDLENRTFPRGLDIEIFDSKMLYEACQNADKDYELEHVTPYIYEKFDVVYYKNNENTSNHRWTLDTKEDWSLIEEIYNGLYKGEHDFYYKDILNYIENNKDIYFLNNEIIQKRLGE